MNTYVRASICASFLIATAITKTSNANYLNESIDRIRRNEKPEAIAPALSRIADINQQGYSGRLALVEAAKRNQLELVTFLLEHGANVNLPDNTELTPLLAAAQREATDTMYALIDAGAQIDGCDNAGYTPLMHCARKGNTPGLARLLAHKAATHIQSRGTKDSALHIAVAHGHASTVTLLLPHLSGELTVNSANKHALMLALDHLDKAILNIFMSYGYSLHLTDKETAQLTTNGRKFQAAMLQDDTIMNSRQAYLNEVRLILGAFLGKDPAHVILSFLYHEPIRYV